MASLPNPWTDSPVAKPVGRAEAFVERGVALPVTTPMLVGVRMRQRAGKPAELILPSLAGRGTYVLGWEACVSLAQPTVHDRRLWARLAGLPRLTPATVRGAARALAALGYAGREAQTAAVAALNALTALRRKVRVALEERLAALLALPDGARRVQAVATLLSDVGPGEADGPMLRNQLAALTAFAAEARAVAPSLPDPAERQAAQLIAAAAQLTLEAVPVALRPLRTALADLPGLCSRSQAGLDQVCIMAERADWLLDGWAHVVAAWRATPAECRGALLGDLMAALPILPREADAWTGPVPGWDAIAEAHRRLHLKPGWTQGMRMDMVAAQERVRALAA